MSDAWPTEHQFAWPTEHQLAWSAEEILADEPDFYSEERGSWILSVGAAALALTVGGVGAAGLLYFHHVTHETTTVSAPPTHSVPLPAVPAPPPPPPPPTEKPIMPSVPAFPQEHAPEKIPTMAPPSGLPVEDRRLLEKMRQQDVGDFTSQDAERTWVGWAHQACQAIRGGAEPEAVDHVVSQGAGMPLDDAMLLVGDAQLVYSDCYVGAQ
jgi:hypothetical protein